LPIDFRAFADIPGKLREQAHPEWGDPAAEVDPPVLATSSNRISVASNSNLWRSIVFTLSAPNSLRSPLVIPRDRSHSPLAMILAWLAFLAMLVILPSVAQAKAANVSVSIDAGLPGFPVKVFVSVTDEDSEAVVGLDADEFGIRIRNRDVSVDSVLARAEEEDQQISVAFVLDLTTTVRDARAVETVKQATFDFIQSLDSEDWAAVVKYNWSKGIKVQQPFRPVGDNVQAEWFGPVFDEPEKGFDEGFGTNTFDALFETLQKFPLEEGAGELPKGIQAVVLVSDGEDNRSDRTLEDVVAQASGRMGVRIFTIGVAAINEEENIAEGWLDNMLDLARKTGGRYEDATLDQEGAVEQAYSALSGLLQSEYILTLDTGVNNCEEQDLTVEVNGIEAETTFSHTGCLPDGGSGGGGSLGLLELLAGLSLLALRRRLGFA